MKIEHIAIWAEDLDALCAFYVNYFGMTASAKYHNPKRNFTSCFLSFAGESKTRIEVMHIPEMSAPPSRGNLRGPAHFAISAGGGEETAGGMETGGADAAGGKKAVDALTERLRADGYTIASEPRTTGDGYYESVVLDPEGNFVEIVA